MKPRETVIRKRIKEYDDWTYVEYEYDCPGAGALRVSMSSVSSGGKSGVSIGVEWGVHGFTGGVLPWGEALQLAQNIRNAHAEWKSNQSQDISPQE